MVLSPPLGGVRGETGRVFNGFAYTFPKTVHAVFTLRNTAVDPLYGKVYR